MNESITKDDWLTTAELAKRLGVKEVTVRKWRVAGTGPKGFKMGGGIRYMIKDVNAWVLSGYHAEVTSDDGS